MRILLAAAAATVSLAVLPASAQQTQEDIFHHGVQPAYSPSSPYDSIYPSESPSERSGTSAAEAERRPTRAFRTYDWNHPDPATGGYFAEDYAGYGPDPETLGGSDRIYRGRNGHYYCRRYDASTQPLDRQSDKMLGEALPIGESALLRTIASPALNALMKQRKVRCGAY